MASIVGILSPLLMIVYVGVYIYIISLLGRLVRAVENIANKIDSSAKI